MRQRCYGGSELEHPLTIRRQPDLGSELCWRFSLGLEPAHVGVVHHRGWMVNAS
jgi:hypothetical protein